MGNSAEKASIVTAFRCPQCGAGVISAPGFLPVLEASGRITMHCSDPDCPASVSAKGAPAFSMDLRLSGPDSINATVPCIFCGNSHSFTISKAIATTDECAAFTCPTSGIELAFFGDENFVKFELDKSELELLDALGDSEMKDITDFNNDTGATPDPEISDIINFVVRDLEAEGKILCKCAPSSEVSDTSEFSADKATEDNPDGNAQNCAAEEDRITLEPGNGYITVRCTRCGAAKVIPAVSLIAAHSLIDIDSLTLE